MAERETNALGHFLDNTDIPTFYRKEIGNFNFSPYQGVIIAKSNGKLRPLLVPAPKDRIVLSIVFKKIYPILKPVLKRNKALGLGIRKKEELNEMKKVLTEIQKILRQGQACCVLKLDFKDFFSSINRKILFEKLDKFFRGRKNREILKIVKDSVENPISSDALFKKTFFGLKLDTVGIPQGLAYSPLLASFYALDLDSVGKKISGSKNFRYLDDMVVLARDVRQAKAAYKFLKKESIKLGLKLHELGPNSKTEMIDVTKKSFVFLGIGISKDGLYIPEAAINRFKKVFESEIMNAGIIKKFNRARVLSAYAQFARGWVNHYKKLCPENFAEVERNLLQYLNHSIEKHKTRKTVKKFFGEYRLTLSHPYRRTLS